MPRLLPDDELRELSGGAAAAAWALGTLLLGVLGVVIVAVLLFTSNSVGFGHWGALAVAVLAVAAGALAWRRGGRRGASRAAEPQRPAPAAPRPQAKVVEIPPALRPRKPAAKAGPPPADPAAVPIAEASSPRMWRSRTCVSCATKSGGTSTPLPWNSPMYADSIDPAASSRCRNRRHIS